MTADALVEDLQRMAHSYEGPGASYGDWMMLGDGVHFNPAHVVYIRDVETPTPSFAAISR